MNAEELIAILRHGEGPHVEFKSDFPKQSDDIAKEMAALANSGGGILLMGVADDGSLPGIPNADQAGDRLAGLARFLRVSPEIDKFQLSKKVFIVYVRVHPCPPCFFRDRIYHRVGSSSEPCTSHEQLNKILTSHAELTEPKSQTVTQRRRAVWSGYWFVNVGEGAHRNWDDNRAYGFISAGGGAKYSNFLKRLKVGDKIFAYMTKLGYVGFGEVTSEAVMIRDFYVKKESKSLLELPLKAKNAHVNSDSPELSEWGDWCKVAKIVSGRKCEKVQGDFC